MITVTIYFTEGQPEYQTLRNVTLIIHEAGEWLFVEKTDNREDHFSFSDSAIRRVVMGGWLCTRI